MGKQRNAKTRKRIAAAVVAASMVASMLPFNILTAFAAGGVKDTLDASRPTAKNQLTDKVKIDDTLILKSVTLDGQDGQVLGKDAGEGPQKFFDGDTTTKGGVNRNGKAAGDKECPNVEVHWQTTEAVTVGYYTLANCTDETGRDPAAWTLYGSSDGTDWTQLDARTKDQVTLPAADNFAVYYEQDFQIADPKPFDHYKMVITEGRAGVGQPNYFQMSEIVLAGPDEEDPPVVDPVIDDAILHYDFADGAKDVSGNNNDGEIAGWDGVDDTVAIANGIATFTGTSKGARIKLPIEAVSQESYTLTMMAKVDADYETQVAKNSQYITLFAAGDHDGTPSGYFQMLPVTNDRGFVWSKVHDSVTYNRYATGQKLPAGDWHQVTVTFDKATTTVSVYVDGDLQTRKADNTDALDAFDMSNLKDNAKSDAYLGGPAHNWEGNPAFRGQISDFRIFDRAITAEEVATLTAENLKEFDDPQPASDTILHYDFADGAKDASDNGNDGEIDGNVAIADGIATFSSGKIKIPMAAFKQTKTISMMVKANAYTDPWWPTLLEAGPSGAAPFVKITSYSKEAENRHGIGLPAATALMRFAP